MMTPCFASLTQPSSLTLTHSHACFSSRYAQVGNDLFPCLEKGFGGKTTFLRGPIMKNVA